MNFLYKSMWGVYRDRNRIFTSSENILSYFTDCKVNQSWNIRVDSNGGFHTEPIISLHLIKGLILPVCMRLVIEFHWIQSVFWVSGCSAKQTSSYENGLIWLIHLFNVSNLCISFLTETSQFRIGEANWISHLLHFWSVLYIDRHIPMEHVLDTSNADQPLELVLWSVKLIENYGIFPSSDE